MKNNSLSLLACLVFLLAVPFPAPALEPEGVPVKCAEGSVIIDGKMTEKEWTRAFYVANFIDFKNPLPAKTRTEAFVLYDDQNLYVAFKCSEPNMPGLLAQNSHTNRDGAVWVDDCVEVYIDGNHSHSEYYHFIVNSRNTKADEKTRDSSWDGIWESAVGLNDDYWCVEMKIPFQTLNLKPGNIDVLGINFCREKYGDNSECSAWSCTYGGFNQAEKYGHLKNLQHGAAAVDITDVDWGGVANGRHNIKMKLANRSDNNWSGMVIMEIRDVDGKLHATYKTDKLTMAANREITAIVDYNAWKNEGRYVALLNLADEIAGKQQPVFSKNFNFPPLMSIWRKPFLVYSGEGYVLLGGLNETDLSPYTLKADIKNLDGKSVWTTELKPESQVFQMALLTGKLNIGKYQLVVELFYKNNIINSFCSSFEVISGL